MSGISNYMTNTMQSIQTPKDVVNTVDNLTYYQQESSNPLRLKYDTIDSFENKKIKKTATVAQGVGAEVFSLYSNPFYLLHKLFLVGKFMFKEFNKIATNIKPKYVNSCFLNKAINEAPKLIEVINVKFLTDF